MKPMTDPVARVGGALPHCDQRVLHRPGTCRYCDEHPEMQATRMIWGIAYTGESPKVGELPCPSDAIRGQAGAHVWLGNQPEQLGESPAQLIHWVPDEEIPLYPLEHAHPTDDLAERLRPIQLNAVPAIRPAVSTGEFDIRPTTRITREQRKRVLEEVRRQRPWWKRLFGG